jgi:hypothetical protein
VDRLKNNLPTCPPGSVVRQGSQELRPHETTRDPEDPAHESLFDRRHHRLEHRWQGQTCNFAIEEQGFRKSGRRLHLTGDCQNHGIRPVRKVAITTDDDRGSLLRSGLVGERKRNQNDVAECEASHGRGYIRS